MYLQTLSANQDEKFSFVSGCTGFVQTEIIGSDLLRLLERSALAKNPTREYVYGPSTAYLAVEVNGERTPIRSYDPTNLYAWGGLEVGSCPYIYTYSNNTNSWVNQGHILYNFVGKESEGFDEIELTDWNDHSVFLKELDPETSFIDHLYLRVVYDDGHEEIIPANDQLLHIVDGDYMVLNQGDSVEITFSAIKEEQGVQNVFVGAYGYYIPYTLLSKSSRR